MEKSSVKKRKSRWPEVRDFLKLLKVDIVVSCAVLGVVIQGVTVIQLTEDKMCINQLHYPKEYCLSLTSNHSQEIGAELVLKHVNSIKNWIAVIRNIPTTVMAAFYGYFLDKYPKYFKLMLLSPLVGIMIETQLLLFNAFFFKLNSWAILFAYLPMALGGGKLFTRSVVFTYITWSTPPHLIIVRFACSDFFANMAITIGTYIGGSILAMEPYFDDQPENYIGIFVLSFIVSVIGLLFALTLSFDGVPKGDPEHVGLTHSQVLKDVFKFSRVTEPFKAALRKRDSNGRPRLLLLILSTVLITSSNAGDGSINYQYAQRVYNFSAKQYTTIFGSVNLVPSLLTPITPNILKIWFKLPDTVIGLIGTASVFSINLIRGTILTPPGFITVSFCNILSVMAPIALRSLISAIAEPHEPGKLFTFTSVIMSYLELGSTFLYTSVFTSTIVDDPGMVYKLASTFLLIPVATCLWLELTRSQWNLESDLEPKAMKEHVDVNGNPVVEMNQVVRINEV